MPSVITTTSGISASTASTTASFAKAGGTNTIDTSAPVDDIASATVPNTGRLIWPTPLPPSCSTVVPALRALTPPTTWVPAFSIRAVCLVPSPPVMHWTMTLLSLLTKIHILSPLLARELGGLVGRSVHRVDHGHQRVVGLVQDPATFLHGV